MTRLLAAIARTERICVACVLLSFLVSIAAVGEPVGVPLPDRCYRSRGDRHVTSDAPKCPEEEGSKVQRSFFKEKLNQCKKFSLCQALVTYMDDLADPTKNYFQDNAECEEACTDIVECLREPLQLENGRPGTETEEGVRTEVTPDQRLGFDTTVTFRCNEGFSLSNRELNRTCQLNGTWSKSTPTCNIQCPKPELASYTIEQPRNHYDVGEEIQIDCMDGLIGSTHWTCLEGGNWTGTFPKCSPGCSPPPVDNAHRPMIETSGGITYFTYSCKDDYTLLNDSSDNCSLSSENYTRSCVNGTLQGRAPVCTRVKISNSGALTLNNGTYYYHTEGNHKRVLTCGLVGVNQEQNSAYWVLPKKANGENPPEVDRRGHRLIFHRTYPVQSGKYICSVCNTNAVVMVDVTEIIDDNSPPSVRYFHPNGTYKSAADQEIHIQTLIHGTLPLKVVWQHNNSNISINSQYNLIEIQEDDGETVFSTLVIRRMKELLQGVYKIVANNSGGITVSQEIMLLLADGETESRSRRSTQFCEDTGKAVLAGTVRRTGRTKSGLQSIRLKVDKVLRGGDTHGIATGSKVDVRIFSGDDATRLRRGQKVVVAGVPMEGGIVYMFDTPIQTHSPELEAAILDC